MSLKIGRFGASDDFNGASKFYSRYLNNGIDGDIRNVLFDTQFSAYPFATWAARLRVEPTTEYERAGRHFSDLAATSSTPQTTDSTGASAAATVSSLLPSRLVAGILEAAGPDD